MTSLEFQDVLKKELSKRYDYIPEPNALYYDYEFSPEFEHKMKRMIRQFDVIRGTNQANEHNTFNFRFRKVAVLALVLILIMALAACAVHYIITWNETNNDKQGTLDVTFEVNSSKNSNMIFENKKPVAPAGYEIVSENEDSLSTEIKYKNGNFEIYYDQTGATENMGLSINNEENNFRETTINGYKAYTSYTKENAHIIWCDGVSCYELIGNIDLETLRTMAESIE